jgi:hypothetical protein
MLYNVVDRSFVLVRASWPAGKVRRVVERLQPSHVIVGQTAQEDAYYLFRAPEILDLLATAEDQASAQEAIGLSRRPATPILDAYADELSAPDQAVVLDEGRIIGFVDADMPPPPITKSRGPAALVEPSPRALVTDFPPQVVVGETHSLEVYVSADMSAGQLPIAVPFGTMIDVVVKPRHGFELVGPREGSIIVTDAEETQSLQFKFKATEVGLGVIRINVYANYGSLGSVTLQSQVVASADEVYPGATPKREQPLSDGHGPVPDLTLLILEHRVDGEPNLTFKLKTREPYDSPRIKRQYGPVPIKVEPQQHFRNFFTQIQNLPDNERDQRSAERQLACEGTGLYQALVPEDLRDVLWAWRERIHSVQIQSQEPWIPWELCKLYGREDGRSVEGQFFCEAFAMTRWLPELANKLTLRLRNVALVVPRDSGLAHAESERRYMLSLGNGGRRVEPIPATLERVLDALKSGSYDGWHFTGHGSAHDTNPDQAKLELDEGDLLRPAYLSGVVANLGLCQPLVFLNACQSGQGAMSLTGIGGWAVRFLRAAVCEEYPEYGAAAFIGTYWKIDDEAALNFARAFYTKLLEEKQTIGEAVRAARLAIRALGDSNWLAYTVFAHPLATVQP